MYKMNHSDIEIKWQKYWDENSSHKTNFDSIKNKFYCLTMFSYPSGDKLHIGHWYNYGPVDTYARYKKMNGYNVFQPQGFDAFGLPAENYAIKHGIPPQKSSADNISKMKSQLTSIGAMFDWDNEVVTSDESYYKWTQWLFLQLYKNKLAYQKTAPVNWCPSCSTVLANEQVKDGSCDRCSSEVTKKDLKQWFFKITDYAEELLSDLDNLDWPQKTKHMQKNWIGKSVGAEITFEILDSNEHITIFTTRPDTIYGVSYIVLAPENDLVRKIVNSECLNEVEGYIENTKRKSEIERSSQDSEKSGIFLGAYAIHPFTGDKIPIWIGDYVLNSYGSGAVMAVPGSDERDYLFAKKYDLPIIEVVSKDGNPSGLDECYTENGVCLNSHKLNGLETKEAIGEICNELDFKGIGGSKIQFRLHDWLISRQRYWGAPIPIIHCDECGIVPVPESELPIKLPNDIKFSDTYGEDVSPLATSDSYMNTVCPNCKGEAKRDPDTMDTFVCSSWYYLRYPNPHIEDSPFDTSRLNWLPVDLYVGGAEHATMHLLYARFITKALRDLGYLNFGEPFRKLIHQGTITKDGAKMSKSKGNSVSPDDFIEKYGSDTFRIYLMFMGPFEDGGDWNDKGITGIHRFLNKYSKICKLIDNDVDESLETNKSLHKVIKVITSDLEELKFNTAISRMMELTNYLIKQESVSKNTIENILLLLAPFAPHLSEELWNVYIDKDSSIFTHDWPKFDKNLVIDDLINIAVQVNGKLRGNIEIDVNADKEVIIATAKSLDNVFKYIDGKNIKKEIYVPKRIVNIVV